MDTCDVQVQFMIMHILDLLEQWMKGSYGWPDILQHIYIQCENNFFCVHVYI